MLVNTPYKRGFYCGDDSIRYPYRPDTITHGLMAGVIITATVSAGEAYLVYTDRLYSRSDFNNYLAALYKVLGTFLFGGAVEVCRGSPADVTESRLSFYSGHSSFGMYCMMFLALYVQARLCWKWARLLRPTVQFFLVAFALYVGYTRVSDHKHHWSDVLVGLLQGALVAGLTVSSRAPTPCPDQRPPSGALLPSFCLSRTLALSSHLSPKIPPLPSSLPPPPSPPPGAAAASSWGSGCGQRACPWSWQVPNPGWRLRPCTGPRLDPGVGSTNPASMHWARGLGVPGAALACGGGLFLRTPVFCWVWEGTERSQWMPFL
ncbi:hypothetical protein E2I00_016072 [Balaenoptera physalus]|uniref:Phosphatidic acid phosphatase type 2/haloperoxidase domain-containing protein n=1 Tax=Balaenoptera physalus TaxID=9770 RepID=A0A643C1P3_BALPH|nr:hypothetical protein E2I00_016072 [Balaenoptera physalus]